MQAENPARGYFERAQTWIQHLATHASSVVVDLTKAVLLDPSYEPQARAALRRARRRLGAEEYDRLVAEAEQALRAGRG
jgi:hypothetical protein